MRFLLLPLVALLVGCSKSPSPIVAALNAPQKPAKPQPILVEDLAACDRRAHIRDLQAEREAELNRPKPSEPPNPPTADNLKVGEDAYVSYLQSFNGRLYVNGYTDAYAVPNPGEHAKIHIRRTGDGFLVECGAFDTNVYIERSDSGLIPVVGKIPGTDKLPKVSNSLIHMPAGGCPKGYSRVKDGAMFLHGKLVPMCEADNHGGDGSLDYLMPGEEWRMFSIPIPPEPGLGFWRWRLPAGR